MLLPIKGIAMASMLRRIGCLVGRDEARGAWMATPAALITFFILVLAVPEWALADGEEVGATTVGARILLLPDGSWILEEPDMVDVVEAIADDGRRVMLREQEDPETGRTKRVWRDLGSAGGLIQVVIARTIQTDPSMHNDTAHCIPVITARNLSEAPIDRLVTDVEFTTPEEERDAASVMFGPLDPGEEQTITGPPLLLERCVGLTGDLAVPYCMFQNNIDCERLVVAGGRGVIPLSMSAIDASDDPAARGNDPAGE